MKNSGAVLEVPGCGACADGTNEVRGLLPDVLVGWRKSDGPDLRATALLPRLPGATAQAQHLSESQTRVPWTLHGRERTLVNARGAS